MKILMLTTNSSLMDGINRHILAIASHVNRLDGCEVAVCTVFPRAELADALEAEGVTTYSLNASNGHDIHVLWRFYKVMKAFRPDVVHVHVLAVFERVVLATLFRSVKYVYTVHGISDKVDDVTLRMRLESMLEKVFSIPYAVTCVVSNGVKEHLFVDGSKKDIRTIYNPIDFSQSQSIHHQLHRLIGVSDDTPIIGTACRFAAVKNPSVFTEVMCRVLQQNQNAHAVVMGDGEKALKKHLQNIVSSYGVSARFHWLGYRQDAPELAGDLNCFVMTSLSEGMPTSLLESMVNKVPFAMMEGNGGLKDITALDKKEGPIGIVVPAGDVEALVTGILRLIEDSSYATSLAEKAFEIGKRHFDIEQVSMQLHYVYKTVLELK